MEGTTKMLTFTISVLSECREIANSSLGSQSQNVCELGLTPRR